MKIMLRNCPTHELDGWLIVDKIYDGLNHASKNLLDSYAGGSLGMTQIQAKKFGQYDDKLCPMA